MNDEQLRSPASLPTNLPPEELSGIFRRLRSLMAQHRLTTNKHELATILIGACIMEGFDTGKRITGALEKLGFNKQHAGKMLADGVGVDPQHYYWRRTPQGTYIML